MEPLAGYIATLGQIGTIGPLALALARLARLRGNAAAARRYLADAREIASRAGGATAELHCRLLDLEWTVADRAEPLTPNERRDLADLRASAVLRDMTGVVRRIDALAGVRCT